MESAQSIVELDIKEEEPPKNDGTQDEEMKDESEKPTANQDAPEDSEMTEENPDKEPVKDEKKVEKEKPKQENPIIRSLTVKQTSCYVPHASMNEKKIKEMRKVELEQ